MGTTYELINASRREKITFAHLPANKKGEIAGCAVAAAVVALYMLEHMGDAISFVASTDDTTPRGMPSWKEIGSFRDVTDEVVDALVKAGLFRDEGREVFWADEPDVYVRRLRNVFDPMVTPPA